ncbi:MAG TPA: signal peptidase I [Clostridia bacterium]|jgi:signal peptidase|nr:signal peptidase I [Clostridia bacterium]
MTKSTLTIDKKKKIIRISISAITWAIFIAIVIMFLSVFLQIITKRTPALFGYRFYYVLSGSMSPEIEPGEVIVSKVYNAKKNSPEIKLDDVVTYIAPEGHEQAGLPITHKVIKAPYDYKGITYIQTQGVANHKADEPIPITAVQGVMTRKSPAMASFYTLLANKNSIMIFIMIVPLFITIVSLIYRLVVTIKQKPNDENQTSISEEEYKQKVISDYLKSQEEYSKKVISEYLKSQEDEKEDDDKS